MFQNVENIKTINKFIVFSGIALLILFFTPSVYGSFLGGDPESFSLLQLTEEEKIIDPRSSFFLLLLAFEIIISGMEFPRFSLGCAILHFVLSIHIFVDINRYLGHFGSIYPSVVMYLYFILPCVMIFVIIYTMIKTRSRKSIE